MSKGNDRMKDVIQVGRGDWQLIYSRDQVKEAALKQVKHHGKRVAWWSEQKGNAEAELKDRGFTLERRYHSGGHDLEAKVDPELARRVAECESKIRANKNSEQGFLAWTRALDHASEHLVLTISDVEYFRL